MKSYFKQNEWLNPPGGSSSDYQYNMGANGKTGGIKESEDNRPSETIAFEKSKQDKKVSPLTSATVLGASRIGKSSVADTAPQTMVEVLGSIYNLLVKIQSYEKLQSELELVDYELAYMDEQDRNKKIIEALGGKKPKKKKAKQKKKEKEAEKVVEKEKAKPEKAPTTTTKAPTKTTTPTATPTAPATPSLAVPTAARVVAGAAAIGVATLGAKSALAANISQFESGKAGYNAYNKGTVGNKMIPSDKPIDFSKMTISEFLRRGALKQGDPDRLFAVGKYQIIPPTMKDLIKQMKLDPDTTYLDPATQDNLFENGLVGSRRKKVDDYIKGKSNDRDGAILQLAQEFASVGIPYDMNLNGKQLKKGDSYYSGVGGNKAHNSPEQVGLALDADRLKNVQKESLDVPKVDTGTKINSASTENKNLKADIAAANLDKPAITVNNNKTTTTGSSSSGSSGGSDDTNAYQRKLKG